MNLTITIPAELFSTIRKSKSMSFLLRQNPFPKPQCRNRFFALASLVCLISICGCSSESEKTTVDPPPITTEPTEQSPTAAPGSIELPKGEIVPKSTGSQTKSGGMEMPSELNPPVGTDAETTNGSAVELKFATWEEVQKIAQSTGKVTVLDVWSTACVPCIRELPGLVELHQSMGDTVQCMTVDIDFDGRKSYPAQSYEEDVLAILKTVKATFPNYASTTESDQVYAAAKIESIPAVFVFDADGKLVKKFVDAGDGVGFGYHKDVIPFVKTLVK